MNLVKYRRIWFILSGTLLAFAVFTIAVNGFKYGIEFTGGSLMVVRFESARPSSVEIERAFEGIDVGTTVIQPVGEKDANIRMKALSENDHQQVLERLKKQFAGITELRFDAIGPAVGAELRSKSIKAILISFLAILIYIAYSFRKVTGLIQNWKYGLITVFTALHDVLIPAAVFSILGKYAGWEVDTTFVVAVLTVLGYSINDTIVVLDRVRENLHRVNGTFEHIVNESLNQTIVRSINTSMTTLLAMVAIFFFGGASLRTFSLALIFGIITGTYSSIFFAPPLLVTWEKLSRK